jgi:hypothetical protein
MSAAENKELIRNMFAELGKGNVQAFLGAMAEPSWAQPGSPVRATASKK